jgi:NADH-quinone oxidoreductase subunit H
MYLDLYAFVFGIVHWLVVDVIAAIIGWIGFHGIANWLGTTDVLNVLTLIGVATVVFAVGFLINITMIWQERKTLGRMMDRRATMVGPLGYLQNIADGLKTFLKEIIIPESADAAIYNLVPVIFIGTSILLLVSIPLSQGFYASNSSIGLILVFAIFCIAPFAVLLGGWASNNKYTLIGGMRAAAQIIAYEIPLILSVVGVVILSGSLSLQGIVAYQQSHIWLIVPQIIGFIVFIVAIVAEVERIPFDLPEAEAELVEGWGTEYGGMRFGLFMLSEYFRGYAGAALAVLLFLGGWSGPFPNIIPEEAWFLLKVFLLFFVFIWLRVALPRVRTDQILNIGWKRLLPLAVVNIFIAIAFKTLGWF